MNKYTVPLTAEEREITKSTKLILLGCDSGVLID